MVLTLSISPEAEASLKAKAAAAGVDVSTYAATVFEQAIAAQPLGELPYDQWVAEFNRWVASHKSVGHFVDDSRESIYAGRGE